MPSIFRSALDAIVLVLTAGTPVAAVVNKMTMRPFADGIDTAVVVRISTSSVRSKSVSRDAPVAWDSTIYVDCYASFGGTVSADEAVDPLLVEVYARLMQDPTLGGVLVSMQPISVDYQIESQADNFVCATIQFSPIHRANGATLT